MPLRFSFCPGPSLLDPFTTMGVQAALGMLEVVRSCKAGPVSILLTWRSIFCVQQALRGHKIETVEAFLVASVERSDQRARLLGAAALPPKLCERDRRAQFPAARAGAAR